MIARFFVGITLSLLTLAIAAGSGWYSWKSIQSLTADIEDTSRLSEQSAGVILSSKNTQDGTLVSEASSTNTTISAKQFPINDVEEFAIRYESATSTASSASTTHTTILTWRNIARSAKSVEIYRAFDSNDTLTRITTITSGTTTYRDTFTSTTTAVHYAIRACNTSDCSRGVYLSHSLK